jgi:hypothetical protein
MAPEMKQHLIMNRFCNTDTAIAAAEARGVDKCHLQGRLQGTHMAAFLEQHLDCNQRAAPRCPTLIKQSLAITHAEQTAGISK